MNKSEMIQEWDSATESITCFSDPVAEHKLWKESGENPEYALTVQDFKAYIDSLPEPEEEEPEMTRSQELFEKGMLPYNSPQ